MPGDRGRARRGEGPAQRRSHAPRRRGCWQDGSARVRAAIRRRHARRRRGRLRGGGRARICALHQLTRPVHDRIDRLPGPQARALRVAFGLESCGKRDRFLASVALLTLLGVAAADRPLLCAGDDAQWLDPPSAGALTVAARRLAADHVALVVASRDPPRVNLPALCVHGLPDEAARALVLSRGTERVAPAVLERIVRAAGPHAAAGRRRRALLDAGRRGDCRDPGHRRHPSGDLDRLVLRAPRPRVRTRRADQVRPLRRHRRARLGQALPPPPALRRAAAGEATPGAAGAALRRTLRAELLVGIGVLAATAALAGYAPAKAVPSGPFSTDKVLGPARLEATVDPAPVGPNAMHLYRFNRRDGRPYTAVNELTLQ